MNFKGLLAAAGALALLAAGLWYSNKYEKDKEGKPAADAPPKILEIPADQVQKVEIKKGEEITSVQRGSDGKWQILLPKPFRADQDAVTSLVGTFGALASDRVIEEKAGDLSGYGLAKPVLAITVTKKDGKTAKLMLGDDTPTAGGTFAKVEGDARVFTLPSFNKSSLDKSFKDLQDKRLLTFDPEKITRIELAAKGQTLEFGKNSGNEWQILKPKPMRADGSNVDQLIQKLKDAKMDPLVSADDAAKAVKEFAGAAPVAVAKVTDASGTQQLEVRKAKDNTYYVKGSAMDGTFKGTADLGDAVGKEADSFRQKKVFDFGWSDPTKIEITDGGKVRTLAKSAEKWKDGAKDMDSTSVQSLVDKLRDLSAVKFADAGYTTPVFTALVVSNDGKRTEKVLISKTGEKYFAIRENEAPVYEIDKKAFEDLQKAAADVKEPPPPAKKDEKKDGKK